MDSALGAEQEGRDAAKLRVLINSVDFRVYDYIESCNSYEKAITTLANLYVKTPNAVFSRHLLATAKQKPGQTIREFLQFLHSLSKDCDFQNVTAKEYRQEMVRDSFINGSLSSAIRQRLLENRLLNLDTAFAQAVSLDMAQQHSQVYESNSGSHLLATSIKADSETSGKEAELTAAVASAPDKRCFFCGKFPCHPRKACSARNAVCYKCEKRGHFAKCCRSTSADKISAFSTPKLCVIQPAPPCLSYATITSFINGRKLSTLIDSGSSLSFINEKTARSLGLTIEPRDEVIAMVSSNLTSHIQGNCAVDLMLYNQKYSQVNLGVMKGLCTDVLLGGDFQAQHERVVFQHYGSKNELVVSSNCSADHVSTVYAANLKPVSLFNNLSSKCRPIATKSRQFNAEDRDFITVEITKIQSSGVIRPSHSPWRAQVLVVTNKKSGKRRMCIDYSQTINLFTDLDAYPLPSIESLVNKLSLHKVFSTFDLKSAYHQIPIRESDKIYTAFEVNRIPVENYVENYGSLIEFLLELPTGCLNFNE